MENIENKLIPFLTELRSVNFEIDCLKFKKHYFPFWLATQSIPFLTGQFRNWLNSLFDSDIYISIQNKLYFSRF